MGKTSKRVISLILSVLMVLSMASVFCLPTMAAPEDVREIDYDALRTGADTYIINGAWTADDLVAGKEVSYYFRGQTYTETYDAARHFATWADCQAAYFPKINETNIGSYIPTFIFAPGTYTETIAIHTQANILGANAGINPNDTTEEWTADAMADGWNANAQWDTSKETVLDGGVWVGTREGEEQKGPWAYYLEKFDQNTGKKSTITTIVDGIVFKEKKGFNSKHWDVNQTAKNADESASVTTTGGRTENAIIRNSYVRNWSAGIGSESLMAFWDTSEKYNFGFFENVRFEGSTAKGMIAKYMKGIEFDGCYFTGFNDPARVFGDWSVGSTAFGAAEGYAVRDDAQTIVLKNSVYANNNCWGPFAHGLNKSSINVACTHTFTVENNIFYNPTTNQGLWGLFVPYNVSDKGGVTNLNILNNVFKFTSATKMNALVNINDTYQVAETHITVKGNKFLGNVCILGNRPLKGKDVLYLDYGENFLADTEADAGKPLTHIDGSTTGEYANGFDFADATYYLDYAMTTLSTELNITSVAGLGDNVTVKGNKISAMCNAATGKTTPVFTVGEKATATLYSDSTFETAITEIDYDAIQGKSVFYVRVAAAGAVKDYTLEVVTSEVKDFGTALDAGEIEGFDLNNTAVYIEGFTGEDTVYAYWNGAYYGFTDPDGLFVYGSLEVLKDDVVAGNFGDAPRVVMPAMEYGNFTIPFAASFYGTNFAVDPVDKSGAVNPEDEWRLNSEWGKFGDTGVGKITIPAGLEGEVNLIGITMRNVYTDTARTTQSGNLNVTFKNVVADFQGAGISQNYTFDAVNNRSNTADAAFAATYNDSLIFENFFFKDLGSSGYRRFLNERTPVNVTIKNMFWNGEIVSNNAPLGWFKNTTAKSTVFTVEDSMFTMADNKEGLFFFQGQADLTTYPDVRYEIAIRNNKFINKCKTVSTSAIWMDNTSSRVSSLEISGNTFYDKSGMGKAIDASGVNGAGPKLTADTLTVSNNNFIGCVNDNFNLGTIDKFVDSFFTKTVDYNGLVGCNTGVEASDYYWLDMARTAKNTDFDIISMEAGTSSASSIQFDNTDKTISFQLPEGSTAGMAITLPAGAAGKWLTADGQEVENIEYSSLTGLDNTFYYVVTNGANSITYTVNVASYVPTDFKGSYVCSVDGLITDNALMVTPLAANVASGGKVSVRWDGKVYDFTVGVNAFATYNDALAYATTESIAVPEILVMAWTAGTNLSVDRQAKIFAPNFNTMPYIADAYGKDSVGADWAENPEYMANQVTVKDIVIGAGVNTAAEVYGFTFTGAFIDTARSASATSTKIALVNVVKDGIDADYTFQPGNANAKSVTNTDELLIKNLYIKKGKPGGRLIGEYCPSITTFDGMWADAFNAGYATNRGFVKSDADTFIFTIKNSNLRRWHADGVNSGYKANGPLQVEGFGDKTKVVTDAQDRQYVYDNNILHEFGNQTGAGGVGPWYMVRWFPNAFNGMTFKDNFVDAGENTYVNAANEGYRDTLNFFHNETGKGVDLTQVHGEVVITGNTFNGASLGVLSDFGGKVASYNFTVENNFLVENRTDDLANAVGDYPYINVRHHATIGTFWKDYARTIPVDAHKVYDYTLKNDNDKYFVNGPAKVLKYKLDAENDPNVTVTAVEDGYKYDINMTGFIEENLYNNITLKHGDQSIKMSYGSAHTPHTGKDVLSFTSAEELALPIVLNMEVASPDSYSGTAGETETYTLYINTEFKDAGIDAVKVGEVDAAFDAAAGAYKVTLPADGSDEAIAVTPSAGSEATVVDGEGNSVPTVGTELKCTEVEYTINATSAETSATFKLIVVREHSWNDGEITTPATCSAEGEKTFKCLNDETHTKTEAVAVDPEAHTWDEGVVTTPATCSAVGVKTFTCLNDKTHTKTEDVAIDPEAHEWNEEGTVTTPATCQTTGEMLLTCKHDEAHTKTEVIPVDPNAHVWNEGEVTTEPTCEGKGVKTFTCQNDANHTKTEEIEALGHDYEGKVTTEPTCETKGVKTFTCKNDPTHTYTEDIEALGHDYEGKVTTEPTCEGKGVKTFTCKNDPTHTYTEDIEALGHDYEGKVTTEPTCETKGVKTFTCKNDETHTYTEDIEALGHDWDEGKVTTEPTCKTEGVKTLTCKRDEKHTKTEAVPVDPNAHKWGEYVYNNDATTEKDGTKTAKCEYCDATDTVTAEGTKLDPGPEPVDSSKKFTDVEEGRWYKQYIDYVATYGLMNGMGDDTFAPTITLSRAMFVQILANLSGVDTSNSDVGTQFKDVPAGKWFTPAVKWAADNGIVKGISETEFKPSDPVQRQQMCAMLVRYTEYANITLTTDIEKAQFSDDARIQDYAKDAVYACQQAGIIDGMDKETNTFAPRESATRAQVATIMTRFHKNFVAAK